MKVIIIAIISIFSLTKVVKIFISKQTLKSVSRGNFDFNNEIKQKQTMTTTVSENIFNAFRQGNWISSCNVNSHNNIDIWIIEIIRISSKYHYCVIGWPFVDKDFRLKVNFMQYSLNSLFFIAFCFIYFFLKHKTFFFSFNKMNENGVPTQI